nr:uncharacterized mitochondrial protein AtMg00810-like [Tanacetum cinerariifolium]
MSAMGELDFFLGLQVLQKRDVIFLSQDKYVGDILKKFRYSDVRSANTPMDKENPWGKDKTGKDVDLHLYRSMIGSLMYLTKSRPDIMFATIVATSTTEAEYVAAASGCGQFCGFNISCWIMVSLSPNTSFYLLSNPNNTVIIARLAFCDYHNMIAFLEKYEHNVDFHQIVDFVEASHIRIKTTDEGTKILATVDGFNEFSSNIATDVGEGSGTPTEPHHIPYPEAQQSPHNYPSSPSQPTETTEIIPTSTPTKIPTLRQYSRRARIAQSKALPTAADEPTSPLGDDKLTDLCTRLQRQHTEMATKIAAQDLEISNLKARIKLLENKDGGGVEPSREDATIKGRCLETGEEADATNILTSGVQVVSVLPAAKVFTVGIPTGSGLGPTARPIFTTASVVTPYSRHKVLKSHSGWKTKHFKGMTLEEIREKFILVWKQIEDFVTMASKEEGERMKRKGLMLEHESAKKIKTSEEVSEEDLKEMMVEKLLEDYQDRRTHRSLPIFVGYAKTDGQRRSKSAVVLESGPTFLKTQVVKGIETVMPITFVEDKAQRRLEVKARSTLMMGIPNEHQLKFNSIKDAKQLMEAIEKRFINIAQVVNTANEVSTAGTQLNIANINNLSDVVICVFLACQPSSPKLLNEDLEQIHPDDLEEIDLKWQMTMLIMRARIFLKNTKRKLNLNGNETVAFDKTKILDNYKKGLGYNVVLPPYTGLFMPPKPDLSYIGLEEFNSEPAVETLNAKTSEDVPKMMDYALWDVIESGPTFLKTQVVKGIETVMPITFVEDKAQRRLEVKARSTLMMGIPNEHQLKFNSIKDAKQLMEAIEKRFSGNAATKKT